MYFSDITECVAVPGANSIIDALHPVTGLALYSGKTVRALQAEEPGAVQMSIDAFLADKALRQNTPITWATITEEQYDDWLECLPPAAYRDRGFLVGEPTDHDAATGQPRYQACRISGNKFEASSRPMTINEFNGGIEP